MMVTYSLHVGHLNQDTILYLDIARKVIKKSLINPTF